MANQVLYKSQENYLQKATQQVLHYGNQSFIFNHYRAGEKPDYDKMLHAFMVKRTMESKNCDLANYIKDRIADKLEPCEKKRCLSDIVNEYKKQHNKTTCSDTDIVCENIGLVQF